MISVFEGKEITAALDGGADIIDVKNPAEGPLGAPSPEAISDVCNRLKGNKPFSIALGEFPNKPNAAALAALGGAHFLPDFIKVAFVSHTVSEEIFETLRAIKKSLRFFRQKKIALVSVAYADTLGSASWNLSDFATVSKAGGADGCLVDTSQKNGKSLPDYLSRNNIERFIADCRKEQLFCGLAGSLRIDNVTDLCRLEPDIIGVRSAVCGGDRLRGTVSAQSVRELRAALGPSGFRGAERLRGSGRFPEERAAFPDLNR
ncbi:(5-formylfuran-3-yl)methyl phosphate synthase [Desulfoscipio sp. XC116]|uniref:(5-formylfuran-3-yl)methyl phosphate synthase n=1 Tax=Desulfoscipio sp. XC116 TaxID=3144975 RepID=UPI00325B7753